MNTTKKNPHAVALGLSERQEPAPAAAMVLSDLVAVLRR